VGSWRQGCSVRGGGRERQRTGAATAQVLVVWGCEQAEEGSGGRCGPQQSDVLDRSECTERPDLRERFLDPASTRHQDIGGYRALGANHES
jgi:hypothetical protein